MGWRNFWDSDLGIEILGTKIGKNQAFSKISPVSLAMYPFYEDRQGEYVDLIGRRSISRGACGVFWADFGVGSIDQFDPGKPWDAFFPHLSP